MKTWCFLGIWNGELQTNGGSAALVKHIADDPERRQLRALVNNAGIAVNAPVEVLPLSEWRRLFDVNFFGHIAMTQGARPHREPRGFHVFVYAGLSAHSFIY